MNWQPNNGTRPVNPNEVVLVQYGTERVEFGPARRFDWRLDYGDKANNIEFFVAVVDAQGFAVTRRDKG